MAGTSRSASVLKPDPDPSMTNSSSVHPLQAYDYGTPPLPAFKACMESLIGDFSERLLAQTGEQLAGVRRQVEILREELHSVSSLQRLQGLVERTEALQQSSNRTDSLTAAETKLIMENCTERLQRTLGEQMQSLSRTQLVMLEERLPGFKQEKAQQDLTQQRYDRMSQGSYLKTAPEPKATHVAEPGDVEAGDLIEAEQYVDVSPRPSSEGATTVSHTRSAVPKQVSALMRSYTSTRSAAATPRNAKQRLRDMVDHVAAALIVANIIWMAVEAEQNMKYVLRGVAPPSGFVWVNVGFCVVFSLELMMKMALDRGKFFTGRGHKWNYFDMVLVGFTIIDLLLTTANLSFFRVLRGLRAIRAARIIRTVRIVRELRVMVAAVACSVHSLFWAFVLLFVILFLCAMGVQQTVQSALEQNGLAEMHPALLELYGNLPRTMLTLFMAISGGADWKDLAEPLEQISRVYLLAFVFFVILVVFGMLNILTAVFVEATANIGQVDADLVVQTSLGHDQECIKNLMSILKEADVDNTGTISLEEFEVKMEDPRFRAQMKLLDLALFDAEDVFRVLGDGDIGEIAIDTLVFGLMRLKGPARATDMVKLLHEHRLMDEKIAALAMETNSNIKMLKRGGLPPGARCSVESSAMSMPTVSEGKSSARDLAENRRTPSNASTAPGERTLRAVSQAEARPEPTSPTGTRTAKDAISDVLDLIEVHTRTLVPDLVAPTGGSSVFSQRVQRARDKPAAP